MKISEIIQKRRTDLGWSEIKLASMIPVGVGYIRSIEKGNELPGEATFTRICVVLDLDYDSLIVMYKREKNILQQQDKQPTKPDDNAPILPDSPNFKPIIGQKFHICDGCGEYMGYNRGFRTIIMHNAKDMDNVPMSCPKCFWQLLALVNKSGNESLKKIYLPFNVQLQNENKGNK